MNWSWKLLNYVSCVLVEIVGIIYGVKPVLTHASCVFNMLASVKSVGQRQDLDRTPRGRFNQNDR